MLVRLEMKLKSDGEINYQMTPLFHGALMELLEPAYADELHISGLHPFAQHLEYRKDTWYWIICCLNKQAVQNIIYQTLMPLESITIKKNQIQVDIIEKRYEETSYKTLMDRFYEEEAHRYVQIHFVSPTAFKQKGKYLFYPDLRCIFQSLMNKYDRAAKEMDMIDEETLELLYENSQITQYDLKSVRFSLEGVKIPAFIGKVTIKMTGPQMMTNFANMLFEFGEYSGVGIKSSLGMGCMKIMKEGRKV